MNKPIKASDENALEELKAKADMLRSHQEEMKKANAYFRKNCSMHGYTDWTDTKPDKVSCRRYIERLREKFVDIFENNVKIYAKLYSILIFFMLYLRKVKN